MPKLDSEKTAQRGKLVQGSWCPVNSHYSFAEQNHPVHFNSSNPYTITWMEVYYLWFTRRCNDFKKTLIIYKMVSDLTLVPPKRHSIPQTIRSKKPVCSLQTANSFKMKWLQKRTEQILYSFTQWSCFCQTSAYPRMKPGSKIRDVAGIAFLVSPK